MDEQKPEIPAAPSELSPESAELWRYIVTVRANDRGPAWHSQLREALLSRDRCEQARKAIDVEGLTVSGPKGLAHSNPNLRIERESRLLFVKIMKNLGLDFDKFQREAPPPAEDPLDGIFDEQAFLRACLAPQGRRPVEGEKP